MKFKPKFCPCFECPSSRTWRTFRYKQRGFYRRKCDGRLVQRFQCTICHRSFSTQSFRLDFGWRKPGLHLRVFDSLVSKVSLRQMARIFCVQRLTIERRFQRLGHQAKSFQFSALSKARERDGIHGMFQLDEQETFERDRRLRPVTLAVIIEKHSYFVLHGETAPLPCRGNLSPANRIKRDTMFQKEGKRKSGSKLAVLGCFQALRRFHCPWRGIDLQTDRKRTYPNLFKTAVSDLFASHQRVSGQAPRNYGSVLFPINHTLAMMRDGISRLVRRSWCVSKCRRRLACHFWIWAVYRNFIRGITVVTKTTPAQALGVATKPYSREEITRWRWPQKM
jgi:transposase-like protein